MTLTLFSTSSPTNALNKNIVPVSSELTVIPYNALDILSPVIICDYNQAYLKANYCYITEFDRYYFCELSTNNGSQLIIKCECDPLYTYKEGIKNSEGTILRSESIGKPTMIPDSNLPILPNIFEITSIPFTTSPFINSSITEPLKFTYILTTITSGDDSIIN